jgi:hypothetical protein
MYAITDSLVLITYSYANLSINFGNKQTCLAVLDLVEVLDWLCKSMHRPTNKNSYVVLCALCYLERYAILQDALHSLLRSSTY